MSRRKERQPSKRKKEPDNLFSLVQELSLLSHVAGYSKKDIKRIKKAYRKERRRQELRRVRNTLAVGLFGLALVAYFGGSADQRETFVNPNQITITVLDGGQVRAYDLPPVVRQSNDYSGEMAELNEYYGQGISQVFMPPVQYWAPLIVEWSRLYGVDPNMAATIMQVESCGDPQAISSAGAQGLFQVMPYHFEAGENFLDPATNARRGLNYFAERMKQTDGDVGRAFAGYNGGHGAAATSWDQWNEETQRYYKWTTGIYDDIQAGQTESDTLKEWLKAGGASLCDQATQRLGLR